MMAIKKMIFPFAMIFLLFSCKTLEPKSEETITVSVDSLSDDSGIDPAFSLRKPKMHSEYSKRTVILSFSEKPSEEDAKKLAEKMNLELLYFYSNFNMCALSAKKDLSDEEMSALIKTLEAEPNVIQVLRDSVMHLDSQSTN